MSLQWRKKLSMSDAQQKTRGARMPFLRFTKGNLKDENQRTWFREVLFSNPPWTQDVSPKGEQIETAEIRVNVSIAGENLGIQTMRLDHCIARAGNHNAPTTHLHYDDTTRRKLESVNLAGHIAFFEHSDSGEYSFRVP
jgi:hypothetical protein